MKKRILMVLLFALMLTACGSKTSETGEQTQADQVRSAIFTEIDNMDPYKSAAGDTRTIMDNIFDGLLDMDASGNMVPSLAKSYQISDDHLTYVFQLQEGVKFHNGQDFTADDVMYSLDKLSGVTGGEAMSSKFENIAGLRKISDYEVEVTLKEVDASFLSLLIEPIVPKGYEMQETTPVGTGPFKFVSRKPGEQIVMECNDEYYLKDKIPKYKTLTWIRMQDMQTAISALKAGELDVIPGITAQAAEQLKDSAEILSGPQNLIQLMALNNTFKPLDDVRVRQAINYAIDKDDIIATVAEGRGVKLFSNFSPALMKYYNEALSSMYDVNIDKAKTLLKEAGYENGFDLKLTVPTDYQFHMDTAEMIVNQLGKIGIRVTIDPIEFSTWLERVYTNRDYESTVIGFVGYGDPHEILGRYASDYNKNFINFKSARFDDLVKKGRQTTDDQERVAIYKEAQKVLAEEAASVYIQDPDRIVAIRKGLEGLELYPIQKMNMEDLKFTK